MCVKQEYTDRNMRIRIDMHTHIYIYIHTHDFWLFFAADLGGLAAKERSSKYYPWDVLPFTQSSVGILVRPMIIPTEDC